MFQTEVKWSLVLSTVVEQGPLSGGHGHGRPAQLLHHTCKLFPEVFTKHAGVTLKDTG